MMGDTRAPWDERSQEGDVTSLDWKSLVDLSSELVVTPPSDRETIALLQPIGPPANATELMPAVSSTLGRTPEPPFTASSDVAELLALAKLPDDFTEETTQSEMMRPLGGKSLLEHHAHLAGGKNELATLESEISEQRNRNPITSVPDKTSIPAKPQVQEIAVVPPKQIAWSTKHLLITFLIASVFSVGGFWIGVYWVQSLPRSDAIEIPSSPAPDLSQKQGPSSQERLLECSQSEMMNTL